MAAEPDPQPRRRAPRTSGRRTTLRVPPELDARLDDVARELGTTANDALVLLATNGLRDLDRRRTLLTRSRRLVADYERERGPIPDELLADVDRLWPA